MLGVAGLNVGLGQERSAPLLQGALMLAKKKREPKLEQPLEKDAFFGAL